MTSSWLLRLLPTQIGWKSETVVAKQVQGHPFFVVVVVVPSYECDAGVSLELALDDMLVTSPVVVCVHTPVLLIQEDDGFANLVFVSSHEEVDCLLVFSHSESIIKACIFSFALNLKPFFISRPKVPYDMS